MSYYRHWALPYVCVCCLFDDKCSVLTLQLDLQGDLPRGWFCVSLFSGLKKFHSHAIPRKCIFLQLLSWILLLQMLNRVWPKSLLVKVTFLCGHICALIVEFIYTVIVLVDS